MTTLNLLVGASADDCTRRLTSSWFSTTVATMWCGDSLESFYDYSTGQRFTNVTIGQGDTIDAASMQIRAHSLYGAIPTTYIDGEAADNAVEFVDAADYDGRDRTTASVSWTPPAWTSGTWYTSTEIKTVIQEIVDRGSWASGNALVTFWRDAAGWGGSEKALTILSYDSNPDFAVKLDIDYTAAAPAADEFGAVGEAVGAMHIRRARILSY